MSLCGGVVVGFAQSFSCATQLQCRGCVVLRCVVVGVVTIKSVRYCLCVFCKGGFTHVEVEPIPWLNTKQMVA